jgi:hypothetical protein
MIILNRTLLLCACLKNGQISDTFLNLEVNSTRIKIKGEIQDKIPAVVAVAIVFFFNRRITEMDSVAQNQNDSGKMDGRKEGR